MRTTKLVYSWSMLRFFVCLFLCFNIHTVAAAEPLWVETFDSPAGSRWRNSGIQLPERGGVLHISIAPTESQHTRTVVLPLPMDKIRGQRVFFSAEVKTQNISKKPSPWNGVKVMLIIETPGGKDYPQPEIPEGSSEWQRYSTRVAIPESATNVVAVLGLEQVTGEAWFDNARIVSGPGFQSTLRVDPTRPIFRGHDLPRLRGAMAGTQLKEEDVRDFGSGWNGNLLRLQIFEAARQDRPLEQYDEWLEGRLQHIDRVLDWCERYKVRAVIDLHSPPGGQAFSAGYITARGRIFTDPKAQAKFIEVWEKIAKRYKNRGIIWGFDLMNEADDSMLAETCLDWNSLVDKAARAVRAVDPDRTLIVEPNEWGGAQGFSTFKPLDLPGVVYSFHFYQPMQFTHQGIHGNPDGVSYPGMIAGAEWNGEKLEQAMRPAIEFARKYRVHMYVGEFSAIRTAPGDSAAKYLADVIGIFEKHGFDWSYHAYREWQGWSLEHEGPLDKPQKAEGPTDRQKVVTEWFARNLK